MAWKWVRSALLAMSLTLMLAELPIYEVDALPALLVLSPVLFAVFVALDQMEKDSHSGSRRNPVNETRRELVWFDLIVPDDENKVN